jgi:hypothetical protein
MSNALAATTHCMHYGLCSTVLRTTPPGGVFNLHCRLTSDCSGRAARIPAMQSLRRWRCACARPCVQTQISRSAESDRSSRRTKCRDSKSESTPQDVMGKPLAILNNSKARPGVSLTADSTSLRRDRLGLARKAWMITSRRPRSVWKVDSYASWHASGKSGLSRCKSSSWTNFCRASVFKPAMPYL